MEITSSHTYPFDTAPHDVLVIICSYIDAGSVFKAARVVSHRLKRAVDPNKYNFALLSENRRL